MSLLQSQLNIYASFALQALLNANGSFFFSFHLGSMNTPFSWYLLEIDMSVKIYRRKSSENGAMKPFENENNFRHRECVCLCDFVEKVFFYSSFEGLDSPRSVQRKYSQLMCNEFNM